MGGAPTTRRTMLGLALAGAAAAVGGRGEAKEPPVPALPLRVAVAQLGEPSRAVVEPAFVGEQLARLGALLAPHGVTFVEDAAARRALPERHARLETRSDRDALAAHLAPGAISVFFVASLRDVDDPRLLRMGVTWRKLTDLAKKYVIVSSDARPTTLAHEIGHYLGLGHTSVLNNLMSYERDGGEVFLDAHQGRTIRRTARVLLARGELIAPAGPG